MNACRFRVVGVPIAIMTVGLLVAPAGAVEKQFKLPDAVPNDVFLCMATRHNPNRTFLDQYWGEVLDALAQCGIKKDLFGLIGSFLDAEQQAEVDRLEQRASQLLAGVDWGQLVGEEFVFAERLAPPVRTPDGGIQMGPPDLVWMFRGNEHEAAQNYKGLVAILDGAAEEINRVMGSEAKLVVDQTARQGAEVATLGIYAWPRGATEIAVTLTDSGAEELGRITSANLGRRLAVVLDGKLLCAPTIQDRISKRAMIQGSFTPAEAEKIAARIAAAAESPPAHASPSGSRLQCRLVAQDEDTAAADEFPDPADHSGQAPKIRVLKEVLLDESAIESAHVATTPEKLPVSINVARRDDVIFITFGEEMFADVLGLLDGNPNKEALANETRFKEAFGRLPRADDSMMFFDMQTMLKPLRALADLVIAEIGTPDDVYNNSGMSAEANRLNREAVAASQQGDVKQALALVEQAHEAAPTDSFVLYNLACFNALLGNRDKGLTWLEKAVDGGFYCPRHISNDPDLESIRGDDRYNAALAKAGRKAAEAQIEQASENAAMVKRVVDRLMSAVGILDYVAAIETTDGYAVRGESLAVLVPDAPQRAFYAVFKKGGQLSDFDRYLPEETESFSVSDGFDLDAVYKFIEDTFRVAGPKGEELWAKWNEIQNGFGVDLEKDVLGWIDGASVSVTLGDEMGWVLMLKVSDEQVAREKVAAAVEFLTTKVGELAAQNPALAMLAATRSPTEHERLEGFENLRFTMSPEPIVWGVADGYLVFGASADAVALCLDTAEGKHPGIRENERVMAEALMPTGHFTSVSLTDKRRLGDELARGIQMVSMIGGMASMAIPDPELRPVITKIAGMFAKLTPVVRKIDFYKSTATNTTFDGQTWHTHMVTHYVSPEERAGSGLQ